MNEKIVDAIVLKSQDYKENDKIVYLFSPAEGKFSAVLKGVKKVVKKQPQEEWVPIIRSAFNSDSLMQVRMVRGPFTLGKSIHADYYAFGKGERPDTIAGLPVTGVVGKLQKKGPDTYKDVRGEVTADYQNHLEQLWVKDLRKKYTVVLYPEVIATVNKH